MSPGCKEVSHLTDESREAFQEGWTESHATVDKAPGLLGMLHEERHNRVYIFRR